MARAITLVFKQFAQLEAHVYRLVAGMFFLQLVESAFFMLFNFYLKSKQLADAEIAYLSSYRFMAIMALAFPLGLYIKGRRLKPLLLGAAVLIPSSALAVIGCIELGWMHLAPLGLLLLGLGNVLLGVSAMPFLVLNTPASLRSEAMALYFQIHSLTAFAAGMGNYLLQSLWPSAFDDKTTMLLFAGLGFCGLFFFGRIRIQEHFSERVPLRAVWSGYDWRRIGEVLLPAFLIALGAGLTIPFVNLFFEQIHQLQSRDFSLLGSCSFVLVAAMVLFVPQIRRRFGYKMVITTFQCAAVAMLVLMATTEFYRAWPYAGLVAVIAFLLRQPLMNVAAPATSELNLAHLGERNQEMISALQVSIWSGSWFVSSRIFGWLRELQMPYAYIFLTTAALYLVAIFWYMRLIRKVEHGQGK